MSKIKLITGLGNPGINYIKTRHNVGFWLLDQLAYEYHTTFKVERKFSGNIAKLTTFSNEIYLLKPETFMNLSGQSVLAIAHFYKISPEEILVVHDDLDLSCGRIKLKKGGGNGGHNGLKDIQLRLSSPNFYRLRIGIGHPGDKNQVSNFVLKPPLKEEQELLDQAILKSISAFPDIFQGHFNEAMRLLHQKD